MAEKIIVDQTVEYNGNTYKIGLHNMIFKWSVDSWSRSTLTKKEVIGLTKAMVERHGFKTKIWKKLYKVLDRADALLANCDS